MTTMEILIYLKLQIHLFKPRTMYTVQIEEPCTDRMGYSSKTAHTHTSTLLSRRVDIKILHTNAHMHKEFFLNTHLQYFATNMKSESLISIYLSVKNYCFQIYVLYSCHLTFTFTSGAKATTERYIMFPNNETTFKRIHKKPKLNATSLHISCCREVLIGLFSSHLQKHLHQHLTSELLL